MAQPGYTSCTGCGRLYKLSSHDEMEDLWNHDCNEQNEEDYEYLDSLDDYDDTQDQILDQQFLHEREVM